MFHSINCYSMLFLLLSWLRRVDDAALIVGETQFNDVFKVWGISDFSECVIIYKSCLYQVYFTEFGTEIAGEEGLDSFLCDVFVVGYVEVVKIIFIFTL